MVLIGSDQLDICFLDGFGPFLLRILRVFFWKRKKNMGLLIGNEWDLLFQRKGREKKQKVQRIGGAIIVHDAPGDLGEIS